jgi:ferredoxin
MDIPTNRTAIGRGIWLSSADEIEYDGPELGSVVREDFIRVGVRNNANIALQFVIRRIKPLRKLEHRPVFIRKNCIGCGKCIAICPVKAIRFHPLKKNHVVLTDSKCIRCFCCSEVCPENAVEIRRKLFGQ